MYLVNGENSRSPSDYMMKLQQENEALRKELDLKESKLEAQMNSIKTFWSPELKQEREKRKEENQRCDILREQVKLSQEEQQHSQLTIHALHDELRTQRDLNQMLQEDYLNRSSDYQPTEGSRYLQEENERLTREQEILRSTVEEMEGRIEAQGEILVTRDESVKKLLEMLQCRGVPVSEGNDDVQIASLKVKISDYESKISHMKYLADEKDSEIKKLKDMRSINSESKDQYKNMVQMEMKICHLENQLELSRCESNKSCDLNETEELQQKYVTLKNHDDQIKGTLKLKETELMTLQTRFETLNSQQSDNRHHIEVLKESLNAKDQTVAILQTEIDSLRFRVDEKESILSQKQDQLAKVQEEKSSNASELQHLRDTSEVKDRKMNVLTKKIEKLAEVLQEKEEHLRVVNEKLSNITDNTTNTDSVLNIMEDALTEKEKIVEGLKSEIEENKKIIDEFKQINANIEEKLQNYDSQFENSYNENNELHQEISQNLRLLSKKDLKIAQLEGNIQQIANENLKLTKEFQEYQDLNDKTKLSLEFKEKTMQLEEQLREKEAQVTQGQREIDRILEIMKETEEEKHKKDAAIQNLEKVNKQKIEELRSLNKQMLENMKTKTQDEIVTKFVIKMKNKDTRIEELEEALKESVKITTEREVSLSKEKTQRRKCEQKVEELSSEINRIKISLEEANKKVEENKLLLKEKQDKIKKLNIEIKKVNDELLSKKQESLVLQISEKDSTIALLERLRGNKSEIIKLKKEKEKLIHQLKIQSMQFNEGNNYENNNEANKQEKNRKKADEGIWA